MSVELTKQEYLEHLNKHIYLVSLAWQTIQEKLLQTNLLTKEEHHKVSELIKVHDASKLSDEEFMPYARYFYPHEDLDKEQVKKEFKQAVMHHKNHNLHHYETLSKYVGPDYRCYIIEMVCDYIAMGWEFNNYLFEYYESNKDKIVLPPTYQQYLNSVLEVLKDHSLHMIEEPIKIKEYKNKKS